MIHRDKYWSQALDAAAFLGSKGIEQVDLAIQCGSGLSAVADMLGTTALSVAMDDIPHFPAAAVTGHGREARFGKIGGTSILILTGRIHMYEGYDPLTAGFPAAVARAVGARLFIATNAAGGLNQHFSVGDAMVHRDFINFQHDNASAHMISDTAQEKFVDPKPAYNPAASAGLLKSLEAAGFGAHTGVYISVRGPIFETRAELAMMRGFGADAIGMSTVPEVTVCNLFKLRAAGVSIITNACFDTSHTDHREVLDQSRNASDRLADGIRRFISDNSF